MSSLGFRRKRPNGRSDANKNLEFILQKVKLKSPKFNTQKIQVTKDSKRSKHKRSQNPTKAGGKNSRLIPHGQSIHGSEAEKLYWHSQVWTGLRIINQIQCYDQAGDTGQTEFKYYRGNRSLVRSKQEAGETNQDNKQTN